MFRVMSIVGLTTIFLSVFQFQAQLAQAQATPKPLSSTPRLNKSANGLRGIESRVVSNEYSTTSSESSPANATPGIRSLDDNEIRFKVTDRVEVTGQTQPGAQPGVTPTRYPINGDEVKVQYQLR